MSRYSNSSTMSSFSKVVTLIFALLMFISGSHTFVTAFVTPQQQSHIATAATVTTISTTITKSVSPSTTTRLYERQWNFNDGQGPFGLKKNAETWNGRVAQMAFIFVFLQELVFGKGVVQGITDGDPVFIACFVLFFASVGGLTLFLGIKGADNYVDESLGRK